MPAEVVLAINFFTDITEQVRREETRRLLSTANELLGASLDLEENLTGVGPASGPRAW